MPLRFGKTITAAESSLIKVFRGFFENPRAGGEIFQIEIKKGIQPIFLFVEKLANGRVIVKQIASQVAVAAQELKDIAKAAYQFRVGDVISLTSKSSVALALLYGGISDVVLVGTEVMKRGPQFYKQKGFARDLVITALADGTLAFFGLGTFNAIERAISVGGTLFAVSLIGQAITGARDASSMLLRAGSDMSFGVVFALWKIRITNGTRLQLIALRPEAGNFYRNGISVATLGTSSFVGNFTYTHTMTSLFERSSSSKGRWWPS